MDLYKLSHDIEVLCVEAISFPDGIKAAFNKLESIAGTNGRNIFGISKPVNGLIKYRAAASVNFDGEAVQLGCPAFTIQKGFYLGQTLTDWQQNEQMIMTIFDSLLTDERLAPSAHCIEWYKSPNELLCIVLMHDNEANELFKELTL